MVKVEGEIKLNDFGFAEVNEKSDGENLYISPELLR
jgi:hypothetical protein